MNGPISLPADMAPLAGLGERGHSLLRGILPAADIRATGDLFRNYVAVLHRGLNGYEKSLGASATRTVFSLASAPDPIRDFVCSPVLGEIAARALGAATVRVLHFNGVFKPGSGIATPWHQDMGYIPLDCNAIVTLWVPLVPVTPDMGCLIFATGSHRDGPIDLAGVEERYDISVNEPMDPGDISIHSGWTAHRSAPNRSDRMRESVAISYFPDGARVRSAEGGPPMMASLLEECLTGLKPHDRARGPAVPVVYSTEPDPEKKWDERL